MPIDSLDLTIIHIRFARASTRDSLYKSVNSNVIVSKKKICTYSTDYLFQNHVVKSALYFWGNFIESRRYPRHRLPTTIVWWEEKTAQIRNPRKINFIRTKRERITVFSITAANQTNNFPQIFHFFYLKKIINFQRFFGKGEKLIYKIRIT